MLSLTQARAHTHTHTCTDTHVLAKYVSFISSACTSHYNHQKEQFHFQNLVKSKKQSTSMTSINGHSYKSMASLEKHTLTSFKLAQCKDPNLQICPKLFTCFFFEFSFFKYSAKNSFVIGHQTSAHWTFAINPPFTRSNQLASYNFGPIRKFKSVILSSSLTRVAANWLITVKHCPSTQHMKSYMNDKYYIYSFNLEKYKPVSPSLQWDLVRAMTFLNICAGTTCTWYFGAMNMYATINP